MYGVNNSNTGKRVQRGAATLAALLLVSAMPSLLAQTVAAGCEQVLTARQASRCIGTASSFRPIPKLDATHTYELAELIDIAESASPEARIAWAQAKRAMEEAGVQRAQYLPLLGFAVQGSDARVITPFPKPLAPRGYVTVELPTALAQLELQYSLLDYGRRPKLEGSKALEVASALKFGRTSQTIAYQTAVQFFRVQQAMGQLDAAKQILLTAQTLRSNAQSQFDNGRSTLPDVQNAQAGEAGARYDLASAEGEVQKAKLSLTETIGVEPTAEIAVVAMNKVAPEDFDAPVEELIDKAWKNRPDLLARAQELNRAQQATKAARAKYLPEVGLTATGGQTNMWPTADFGQLGRANVSTWSAAVRLKWEIFNGARGHEVNAAMAEQKAAAEEQRATQDAVTRQVWDSYVDYKTAIEQQHASQSFLDSSTVSYESSLDAFRYGVRSLVDVVQAERQLAQARLEDVRARAHVQQSAAALSYAIGNMPSVNGSTTGWKP
ncbi:TolC family protein [Terriglobus tenax]|uniref:TolC family protein n=1 Tax=Terriglobus tenax TaxID=1111115 RepID=UPI0021E0395E|nr:TolC family protein [Terriglobus tenax]